MFGAKPTMANTTPPGAVASLETLLFQATNPANKVDDVNTIKQFCDAVNASSNDGPVVACRILAHKIQSPQEREAVQALAVLEACVKSCGPAFHAEMGKFKFLNEMIKLVSPRYLAARTPEHIKKKVIELLYVWSRELTTESKVVEAYSMLKKQGIVKEDPVYVGGAVFAASLPPRNDAVLNEEQTRLLRKLLQSKNPDDLQQANKIIKGLVKEDERKMDALTRRATELTMVNNNSKLLHEMLDHYAKDSCGKEERQLLKELFQSCEKMQPKLFRLAAEADEHDEGIGEILQASDDIARVIERYKMMIVQGKPDITGPSLYKQQSDSLLDLEGTSNEENHSEPQKSGNDALLFDDLMIGLGNVEVAHHQTKTLPKSEDEPAAANKVNPEPEPAKDLIGPTPDPPTTNGKPLISIDDLLLCDTISTPALVMPVVSANPLSPNNSTATTKTDDSKSSRTRGLEELDLLGENALRAHLSQKSPQFGKKNDKLPLNVLQKKKLDFPVTCVPSEPPEAPLKEESAPESSAPVPIEIPKSVDDVKIADLFVPLTSIKPGSIPPLTLQEISDGISIVLHFGKDTPREHVRAIVVTVISKMAEPISNFELKAVVPKGCKVKLQPPSANQLPAHNPFVPPSAITQVMLISNPRKVNVTFKYVISYMVDGEPQTEMGEVDHLPI